MNNRILFDSVNYSLPPITRYNVINEKWDYFMEGKISLLHEFISCVRSSFIINNDATDDDDNGSI